MLPLKKFIDNNLKVKDMVIMGIDPGETTGVAVFLEDNLINASQLPTCDLSLNSINLILDYIKEHKPHLILLEDYFIYATKSDYHKGNQLHTAKLIGMIITLCHFNEIPFILQLASKGKQIKDVHLKEWDFYSKGKKHSRDAMRHVLFYIVHRNA